MSDHFDRLLARHTPAGPGAGPPARVRPRLPGPFERVDAPRHGPDGPDEPPAPFAAVPASEVRQSTALTLYTTLKLVSMGVAALSAVTGGA
ncbi:hypothetical protein ACWDPI_30365, partial [Streptomyces zhihengii]